MVTIETNVVRIRVVGAAPQPPSGERPSPPGQPTPPSPPSTPPLPPSPPARGKEERKTKVGVSRETVVKGAAIVAGMIGAIMLMKGRRGRT